MQRKEFRLRVGLGSVEVCGSVCYRKELCSCVGIWMLSVGSGFKAADLNLEVVQLLLLYSIENLAGPRKAG